MAREKEAYRDNLESVITFLRERYGDNRRALIKKDVCVYLGRSFDYVVRHYFQDNRKELTAETFARMIS